MAKFRILIADDHQAIRRNLRFLLESHSDWEVSGEAANGREAVEECARLKPDLLITDLDMPELSGMETIRQIRARDPESSIIVLTMYDTSEIVGPLLEAGATAVIAKSQAQEDLVPAVHDIQRRQGWFVGSILARPRHAIAFYRTKEEEDSMLLPFIREGRERHERILHLVSGVDSDGGNGEIAAFGSLIRGESDLETEAVLGHFRALIRDSASRGFALTRIIGDTAWMAEHNPRLPELEPRYNDLLEGLDDVMICAYDVTKFSSTLILDGLRSHPLVWVDGTFRTNPFFAA